MVQFFKDLVHLTSGEMLIKYWPLWLVVVIVGSLIGFYLWRQDEKRWRKLTNRKKDGGRDG